MLMQDQVTVFQWLLYIKYGRPRLARWVTLQHYFGTALLKGYRPLAYGVRTINSFVPTHLLHNLLPQLLKTLIASARQYFFSTCPGENAFSVQNLQIHQIIRYNLNRRTRRTLTATLHLVQCRGTLLIVAILFHFSCLGSCTFRSRYCVVKQTPISTMVIRNIPMWILISYLWGRTRFHHYKEQLINVVCTSFLEYTCTQIFPMNLPILLLLFFPLWLLSGPIKANFTICGLNT
jgi:hypothetical protein